jgi:hypothetical protein
MRSGALWIFRYFGFLALVSFNATTAQAQVVLDVIRMASSSVTVSDTATAFSGSLRFVTAAAAVAESAGFVALTVARTGGSDGAAQVSYRTVPGTATGDDFVGTEGVLTWLRGDGSLRTIQVGVRPDAVWEDDETFAVELFDASGAALGAPAVATVTLKSSGTAKAPGRARLADAAVSVSEAEGVARVTVAREGGSDGAVVATVATVAGSAKAGLNYAATNAVLRWAHGETAPRVVEVALLNDGVYKPDLTFKLQLGGFKGGLTGAPGGTTALVTVRDARSSLPLSEALDVSAWTVTSGASGGWYGQTAESADGAGAAQLYGAGIAKGKDAWMQAPVTGPGVLAFTWRGGARAEDALQFLIGSAVKTQLVGRSGWERVEGIPVAAGRQTLKWRFLRVSGAASADDTAWVDQVVWQPDAAKPAGPAPASGGLVTSEPQQLAWQAAAGAASYKVYLGTSASVQTQALGQTSDALLALPALLPGKSYYWRVDAVSASGRETRGTVWSFKVPAGALARVACPANQSVSLGLPFTLTLALSEGSPAAAGYTVRGLPAGLAASSAGVISGRPAWAGAFAVTVSAANAFGTGPSEVFTLTVSVLPAAMAGTFSGLSGLGNDEADQERSLCGAVQMTVSPAGAISGSVRLTDGTYGFSGLFKRDEEGLYFETPIKHRRGQVSTLQLWPYDDPVLAQQGYRGWLFNAGEERELMLTRNAWSENRAALAEYAGYYTVALPLSESNGAEFYPLGTSYLTVKLEATGTAALAGMLSDGTPWSGSAPAFAAPDGDGLIVPVFAPLYAGVGQLWGVLRIAPNGAGVSDNTISSYGGAFFSDTEPGSRNGLIWQSGLQPFSRLYPDGFDLDLAASGGAYNAGTVPLEARLGSPGHLTHLKFDAIGGGAPDPSLNVTLSGNAIGLPPAGAANPCSTTFRVDSQTGLFTGSFMLADIVSGRAYIRVMGYRGVLAPLQVTYGADTYDAPGSGFFLANGLWPTPSSSWIDSLGVQLLWLPQQ